MPRWQSNGDSCRVYEGRQGLRHERARARFVRTGFWPLASRDRQSLNGAAKRGRPSRDFRISTTIRQRQAMSVRAGIANSGEHSGGQGTRAAWPNALHPILPWAVACLLLLPVPFWLSNAYTQFVVNVICINIILAVGLNIVKGFAGQVTVGHIALAAIGAYTSAVVSTKAGVPFW